MAQEPVAATRHRGKERSQNLLQAILSNISATLLFIAAILVAPAPSAAQTAPKFLGKIVPRASPAATSYTYTIIDAPGAVGSTYAYGINNAGQIVGCDRNGGFLYSGGNFGGPTTSACFYSINSTGQIVGAISNPAVSSSPAYTDGLFYNGQGFVTIDFPGADTTYGTQLYGINDAGLIVGRYTMDIPNGNTGVTYVEHGFLSNGTILSTIEPPGASGSRAVGINNSGQIVGVFADTAGGEHSFLYSGGQYTTISLPPGYLVTGINNVGQIVGVFEDANTVQHSFLYSGGSLTTLPDAPDAGCCTEATGINDSGEIVGWFSDIAWGAHGFLVTPPTQSAAPPTLLQLAYASEDVYSSNIAPPGYTYLGDSCSPNCSTSGVRAAAYLSTDGNYLIIAFRGTVLDHSQIVVMLKDLLQDVSFIVGKPTTYLKGAVQTAASFLNSEISAVARQGVLPRNVYLTGHSLGGALAQILGKKSELNASVFNAPGSTSVYRELSKELAVLPNYMVGGSSTNYRLYGDQVSLAGTQFSKSITIPNVLSNSEIDPPVNALKYTLESHDIGNMVAQLLVNAQASPETSVGPNVLPIWKTLGAVVVTALSPTEAGFLVAVKASGTQQAFDPPPSADYVFAADSGSPLFSCVILPVINGVATWNVRNMVGSTWSAFSAISGGGQLCFGAAGADAIEFQPLNAAGINIVLPDSLLFLASFTKSGKFKGTLTASEVTSAIRH